MVKVMFVCHGNICRSTMAEFVMKDIVKKNGKEKNFLICSSATSTEEIGSDTHWGTKQILDFFLLLFPIVFFISVNPPFLYQNQRTRSPP